MEVAMADPSYAFETEMIEIAEQIRDRRLKLEKRPSDMSENNQLQDELAELIEKRKQVGERWKKALTGQSPEQ